MNLKKTMQILLCAALLTSAASLSAGAEGETVYGTMQIPYDAFYAAEGVASAVDAVSSATTSKWKNENLTAGTYNAENADGSGTILGVVYPVAISQADLDALGDNNYSFTKLDEAPAAYKEVTVTDGVAAFSAVQGATAAIEGVNATITVDTVYGDYCIDAAVNNANGTSDVGRIYGIVLHTADGNGYGMRHLENIWRDEIAWSSGFVTTERHGNALVYDDYVAMVGQTIDQITYITDSGYHTLATSLYVPVKFENTLTVANADIAAGQTAVSMTGFPEDYSKTYAVDGLTGTVTDTTVAYENAMPGSYTLVVSDANGKYANVKTSFTLTTDGMPATAAGNGLAKADGATDAEYQNFLSKISNVTVGENEYAASGKRGVKIIGEDGVIDATAAKGEDQVFAADGDYTMTVAATGYNNTLTFTVSVQNGTATVAVDEVVETMPAAETTATSEDVVTTAPQTGNTALGAAAAVLLLGGAGAGLVLRKKKQ